MTTRKALMAYWMMIHKGFQRAVLGGLLLVMGMLPRVAAGQSFWEMTPYQIELAITIESAPQLSGRVADDLRSGLQERIDAVVGAAWNLSMRPAEGKLRAAILRDVSTISDSAFTPDQLLLDKLIFLGVRTRGDRFQITAREFDCRTRRWGLTVRVDVRQRDALVEGAFQTLLKAFAPVAKVEFDSKKRLMLVPRARNMPTGDPTFQMFKAGNVFQPIVRRNDRDGNPRPDGIQEVPWTFLVVEEVEDGKIVCKAHGSSRNPMNVRRRGRVEQLALAVNRPRTGSRLLLYSRTDDSHPLIGYDIFSQRPGEKSTTLVGRTESDGGVDLQPDEHVLRVLFVKHGGGLLAKIPVVPGMSQEISASVPDDDERLEVEGYLRGLNENLLDLVTRRKNLIGRIKRSLVKGDVDSAKARMDELAVLPTRDRFTQLIDQREKRSRSSDALVQQKIDKLFSNARKTVTKFLDPKEINDTRKLLDEPPELP